MKRRWWSFLCGHVESVVTRSVSMADWANRRPGFVVKATCKACGADTTHRFR